MKAPFIRYRSVMSRFLAEPRLPHDEVQVVHGKVIISRHDTTDQAKVALARYVAGLAMVERGAKVGPSPHTATIRKRLAR